MSCVEKRHMSHRMGSMLHHRFPNGFTDLFMDETDREVSTLTDRAFRSLCVGDDAVYNDEFLYGYSPFSCHKPLAADPLKKAHRKESKKQVQSKSDKSYAQHQKSMSHMSSFLKALSATEESCEGMFIKNGAMTDSKGESWDKSALRSIQRELSEFSSDYHNNLKDVEPPSRKSSKTRNGKSAVKIKKLNIKNFFLHSEFSPFQAWSDLNRFRFGQKDSVLPIDDIPKWYDMSFYKELTEAHRKETLCTGETQSCEKLAAERSLPTAPKPKPPSPPPVLPKPSTKLTEKRCSSDGGDGSAAPWRRNRSRARSVIPVNQPGAENVLKTVDESLMLITQEVRSVDVKAIDEVSSLASTPFSICQLMTPVIPSRQPTETSEILQGVLSPSALDLSLRPHSEAKQTPEPSLKRDGYKSLASSILFNLKDNRKRVKSRYSPPKFKTSELPGSETQSPQPDHLKLQQAGSEGCASGLSTPAILKDGQTVQSPGLESKNTPTVRLIKEDTERPLSADYLLSNLLLSKRDVLGEQSPMSPYIRRKKIRSPTVKKQNYPSLNLYKKASALDSDPNPVQVPVSTAGSANPDQSVENNDLSWTNKESNSKTPTTHTTPLSPTTSSGINKNVLAPVSQSTEGPSSNLLAGKEQTVIADKEEQHEQYAKEKYTEGQLKSFTKKENNGQLISTMDVIRAAKEAISAVKSKALSTSLPERSNKSVADIEAVDGGSEMDKKAAYPKESVCVNMEHLITETDTSSQIRNETVLAGNNSKNKKETPPVPSKPFAKLDISVPLDKLSNGDLSDAPLELLQSVSNSVPKLNKVKHAFAAKQNNYIKSQRGSFVDGKEEEEFRKVDPKVYVKIMQDEERLSLREIKDSEHIIQDLHALKELEMARIGEHVMDKELKKSGAFNIEEEARAKNDLISKELKNIKKGMLSMRGNTQAKRELFSHKEGGRQDHFTKVDNNVRVNKAVFNDNYDKAKMALEEIISDREKRRKQWTDLDAKPVGISSSTEEAHSTIMEQNRKSQLKNVVTDEERQNNSTLLLQDDLKERLGDLRDHNHMKQILSQVEPGEQNTNLKLKAKQPNEKVTYQSSFDSVENDSRCAREQNESKNVDAPPVPPRGKKSGNRKDASVLKKAESSKVAEEENMLSKAQSFGNREVQSKELSCMVAARKETGNEMSPGECTCSQIRDRRNKEKPDMETRSSSIPECDSVACETVTLPTSLHSDDEVHSEALRNENKKPDSQPNISPILKPTFENWHDRTEETYKAKQTVLLNPNPINTNGTKTTDKGADETNPDFEADSETRSVISPLSLMNGVCINQPPNQSPPDQASLSSKSSYFSVESAVQRNTESESNIYHSLENLIVEEVEETLCTERDADGAEVQYYSLGDREDEQDTKTPQKEKEVPYEEHKESLSTTTDQSLLTDDVDQTPVSPSNTLSPPLGIPALFKVKDNTFSGKVKKTIQPWSPRGISVSEKVGEESHQVKESAEPSTSQQPGCSIREKMPENPTGILHSPPPQLPSSNLNNHKEPLKKPQFGDFLTVPQEDDRHSGQSVSSEGAESLTVSTDVDELGINVSVAEEQDLSKVHSEWSGSTCSGTESQTAGLPKPPIVLPKSEKAVLKAIKLTNRRIKKEAQKNTHKSSHGKQKAERQKSDKSKSDSKSDKDVEREKKENGHEHGETCAQHHDRGDRSERRSKHLAESIIPNHNPPPAREADRQGRSIDKRSRSKPEPRHYSSDRIISNVPVYKAHINEQHKSNKNLLRSQSIDRYLEGRVERRLSTDSSVSDRLEPRSQRIEKSIMNELQQRGRSRDKASRDNVVKRSHSIDTYSGEVPNSSALSRQSSQTSQLSRQSSVEHALVTQSFPMTQRKILQDPDSGQYFFVDMPIQIKTKTFFDPQTGSYVQLPVQPSEGTIPQAPPLEVLTPPMVVYRSFVPVPLSPLAPNATIQASHVAPEEQMHCKEMHPYLEPVFAQHDYMLGEFLGTEELDCPS